MSDRSVGKLAVSFAALALRLLCRTNSLAGLSPGPFATLPAK